MNKGDDYRNTIFKNNAKLKLEWFKAMSAIKCVASGCGARKDGYVVPVEGKQDEFKQIVDKTLKDNNALVG